MQHVVCPRRETGCDVEFRSFDARLLVMQLTSHVVRDHGLDPAVLTIEVREVAAVGAS